MVAKADVVADTMYVVKVTRAIPVDQSGRVFMTPQSENVVKGKVIGSIPDDAIESIVEVEVEV